MRHGQATRPGWLVAASRTRRHRVRVRLAHPGDPFGTAPTQCPERLSPMADDLKHRIQEDIKSAMRARDRRRLGALRQVSAAIKQREVDERITLDSPGVVAVLERMRKQRRESLAQFESAGRDDLAAQESFEIELIEGYLPAPLSQGEIRGLIADALCETGAGSMKDMGRVMAWLKPRVQGRADMKQISVSVREKLSVL